MSRPDYSASYMYLDPIAVLMKPKIHNIVLHIHIHVLVLIPYSGYLSWGKIFVV